MTALASGDAPQTDDYLRALAATRATVSAEAVSDFVTDIDDINQCIHIIILTPKGSDPHRPLFGCDQDKYIDAPVNVVRPHLVREATDALRMWEPRIIVERVLVTLSDIAAVDCSIVWRFADASVEEAFVTNLSLGMANIVGSAA